MKVQIVTMTDDEVVDALGDDRAPLMDAVSAELDSFQRWRSNKGLGQLLGMERQVVMEYLMFKIDTAHG